jgi:lipoprotein NlpD
VIEFKFNPSKRSLCGLAFATALVLAGCASTPPAPVEDRSLGGHGRGREGAARESRLAPGSYRVRRGDTLYSIAFRNGLDYRELARANRIEPPYTIYVDQVIRLDTGAVRDRQAAAAARPAPTPSPRVAATADRKPPVAAPAAGRPTTSSPAPAPAGQTAAAPPASAPAPAGGPPAAAETATSAGIVWRWPADGRREGGFVAGDQTRQGIDIAGKSGDPVRAAADGVVVYSGNGLIGYGELIIIKHDASMLSAYGHNRRRLVQEGDRIKAGQQIAEMGSSSASRDMLHFEIRRNGKPVDPLAYLPAR